MTLLDVHFHFSGPNTCSVRSRKSCRSRSAMVCGIRKRADSASPAPQLHLSRCAHLCCCVLAVAISRGLREILLSFAVVCVLRPEQNPPRLSSVRCSCFYDQTRGQCVHCALALYLEGHPSDAFKPLVEQTRRGVTQQANLLSARRSQQSRAKPPPAAAWVTLASLAHEASARYRKRKQNAEKKRKAQEAMGSTPTKKSEPPPEPTRADVLGQMNAELAQAKSLS